MTEEKQKEESIKFIPATTEREIAKNIVFRPIRSWHSGTYAGEQKEILPDSKDHSGCARDINGLKMCIIPYTVTHRVYWHRKNPEYTISAFLSYPDAMGCSGEKYFWETLGTRKDNDIEIFLEDDNDAEVKMEKAIIKALKRELQKSKKGENKKHETIL